MTNRVVIYGRDVRRHRHVLHVVNHPTGVLVHGVDVLVTERIEHNTKNIEKLTEVTAKTQTSVHKIEVHLARIDSSVERIAESR